MNIPAKTDWKDSIEELREDLGRTMDRWMGKFRSRHGEQSPATRTERWSPLSEGGMTVPNLEIDEDDDAINVTAELPGLNKQDVQVEIDGRTLMIAGEKKSEHSEKRGRVHISECSYGAFSRTIPLPCNVDGENAKAKYRRGVLRLKLPKIPGGESRKLEVKWED